MITKDQLDLLRQQAKQTQTLDYTPSGTLESSVHKAVNRERHQQIAKGQHRLSNASQQLKQGSKLHFAQPVPKRDQTIAEATWQRNAIDQHLNGFAKADQRLKKAVKAAFPKRAQETVKTFSQHIKQKEHAHERER